MSRELLLIAVVEDDESFRTALVEAISSFGYGARGFASAEEFVAEDGDKSCDFIVTDIHMMGMSGFDLKRLLASRGSTTPVIMITAHADAALEAKAMADGAVCLLRKPFEMDVLIDHVERVSRI